jgi:hypothetical protein
MLGKCAHTPGTPQSSESLFALELGQRFMLSLPRLALNLRSSRVAEITGMHHHA